MKKLTIAEIIKLTPTYKLQLAEAMRRKLTPKQKLENIERQKMAQEIFKFSREAIAEFERLFPPARHYDPPGSENGGEYGKHNHYSQQVICKDGDYTHVTMLNANSYEDFYARWNRFKNLRVYL